MDAKVEKQVLDDLARFQKAGTLPDPKYFADMLSGESDRGMVIIVGSLIEDLLADRIIEKMPKGKDHQKDLLRQGGPLNSFAAKVNVALALNLIDHRAARLLNILKAMRNACAHSRQDINFRTPELRATLALLVEDVEEEAVATSEHRNFLRLMFAFVTTYLFSIVRGASLEAAQARVSELAAETRAELLDEMKKREASRERQRTRRSQRPRHNPTG